MATNDGSRPQDTSDHIHIPESRDGFYGYTDEKSLRHVRCTGFSLIFAKQCDRHLRTDGGKEMGTTTHLGRLHSVY